MPTTGDAREGFFASPSPEAWSRMDGTTEGIAATWVDATVVGVPSDFYYLAATGPLFSQLLHSPECRAESSHVLIDNVPTFASGVVGSTFPSSRPPLMKWKPIEPVPLKDEMHSWSGAGAGGWP